MNDRTNTVALLESVSKLEPSFATLTPEEMDTDRLVSVATAQLKNCDGLDLLTTVWRGRIITSTRSLLEMRNATSLYLKWLKDNGLTEQKANKLIDTAEHADVLFGEEKLTLNGIANIALKAFEIVKEDIRVLDVVAALAEGGAEVTPDTAKRLLEENAVAQSSVVSDRVKVQVSDGMLPVSKTAKLVSELEKLDRGRPSADTKVDTESDDDTEVTEVSEPEIQRTGVEQGRVPRPFPPDESLARELVEILEEDCSIDSLNFCLDKSKALNKYLDNAPNIANFKDLDLEAMLTEASDLDIVGLVADIAKNLADLENLVSKTHLKKTKLMNLCDRLFVETSASDSNLKLVANKFGLEMKEIFVPLDSHPSHIVRLTSELDNTEETQT